jgi:hypothetical protein
MDTVPRSVAKLECDYQILDPAARRNTTVSIVTSAGGITSWASSARGWRRILHGPFGLPKDLYAADQSVNTSAIVRTYFPSIFFAILALMFGLTLFPVAALIGCCCLRKKSLNKPLGASRCKSICALVTVICIAMCTFIAFCGGVGTAGILLNSFVDIGSSVQGLVDDADWVVNLYPSTLEKAFAEIEIGVNKSCDSITTSVEYKTMAAAFGVPTVAANVVTVNNALQTITTNSPLIQKNKDRLIDLLASLQTGKSHNFQLVFNHVHVSHAMLSISSFCTCH